MKVSIVIPTWNGRALLERHLPGVLQSARAVDGCEVLVSDDGSTDGTTELLSERFPEVGVVARAVNGGFGAAANDGVARAGGDIVVCLNNDVSPEPTFLPPLLEALESDESLFAVAPRMQNARFGGDEARTLPIFRRGMLDIRFPDRAGGPGPAGSSPILYACGGAAAFRRRRFLDLGGFHPIFHPFYWEDVDLGWRAWRRGWGSRHVPAARVHHDGGATIGARFEAHEVRCLYERNRLLFLWSNLLDPGLRRSHERWLLPRAAAAPLRRPAFARALRLARALREEARSRRLQELEAVVLPDREILARLGGI